MKIKVCIANYGQNQLWCLEKILAEFSKYKKYILDITEYTTEKSNRKHYLYHSEVRAELPFKCREHMANDINNFDLFLYNENDHLITEDNIDALLEHTKTLNMPRCSGFYRYEINTNKEKILIDHHYHWGKVINKVYDNDFSVKNNHQGCYLLTKDQLQFCIDSGKYLVKPRYEMGRYGPLEQGATDPYTECGLEKVFPKDLKLLKRLGIQHIPTKYCVKPIFLKYPGLTYEKLLE
jgi:hypothetical protein